MRDCLAQAVVTFCDLARMAERGIYEIGVLAANMSTPAATAYAVSFAGIRDGPHVRRGVHQRYRLLP